MDTHLTFEGIALGDDRKARSRKYHADYMRQWRLKNPGYVAKTKETVAKWKANHPDYWYHYNKRWSATHSLNVKLTMKQYHQRHPDRNIARKQAQILEVSSCVRCGSTLRVERHHPDYSKPLEIIPLCHRCHVKEHKAREA